MVAALTKFKDPRKHIHIGDRIVLWQVEGNKQKRPAFTQSGKSYGSRLRIRDTWQGWYRLTRVQDLERPIPPKVLRADPLLRMIPVIRRPAQGSNFEITHAQWQRIESYFAATTGNAKSSATLVADQRDSAKRADGDCPGERNPRDETARTASRSILSTVFARPRIDRPAHIGSGCQTEFPLPAICMMRSAET